MIGLTVQAPPELTELLANLEKAQGPAIGELAAQQVQAPFTRALIETSGEKAGFGPSGFSRGWLAEANGAGLVVTNSSPVARSIELPTSPHVIEARPGGVLAWMPGRGSFSAFAVKASTKAAQTWIFAKRVNHPGTPGKFVFQTTVTEQAELIFTALATAARTVLGG